MKNQNNKKTLYEKFEIAIWVLHYILFVLCFLGCLLNFIAIALELYYKIDQFYTTQIINLVVTVGYLITFFTLPRFKNLRKTYKLPFLKKKGE